MRCKTFPTRATLHPDHVFVALKKKNDILKTYQCWALWLSDYWYNGLQEIEIFLEILCWKKEKIPKLLQARGRVCLPGRVFTQIWQLSDHLVEWSPGIHGERWVDHTWTGAFWSSWCTPLVFYLNLSHISWPQKTELEGYRASLFFPLHWLNHLSLPFITFVCLIGLPMVLHWAQLFRAARVQILTLKSVFFHMCS